MDEQLDKEMRFHLDQHTADLIAQGYSREEARRQARLALGGEDQVKEDCRDARGTRLLLASIGIYGVLAYLTSQRVPEIGVRMALGADAGDVMWLVLRQILAMILGGVGVGFAAALAAASLLQRLVAGMQPTEPATFALMVSVLVAAATGASFVPAHRASRIDPVRALRQE